jgi:transcriptional regulator with XRE-family HTH domain
MRIGGEDTAEAAVSAPAGRGPAGGPVAAPADLHVYDVPGPGPAEQTSGESDGDADARYQQRLGERLRAVRRSQGLRLQDVEIKSQGRFKAVVVGSYERGDRAVSAHKLAALADFYGVPVTELLPDDSPQRAAGREGGVRLAVDALRAQKETPESAPLLRLVQHIQWLRGDYNGRVLSLRGDDLRTVAVALGVQPDDLAGWLQERALLVP